MVRTDEEKVTNMVDNIQRIAIIGRSGSGKSTLACRLRELTGLPIVYLDHFFWNPGWQQAPTDVFLERHNEAIAQERWIIDGNNSKTAIERFKRADLIIFMQYSRWWSLFRLAKRILMTFGRNRPDMADGCYEQLDWAFIRYVWSFDKTTGKKLEKVVLEADAEGKIIYFRRPRDCRRWLKTFSDRYKTS